MIGQNFTTESEYDDETTTVGPYGYPVQLIISTDQPTFMQFAERLQHGRVTWEFADVPVPAGDYRLRGCHGVRIKTNGDTPANVWAVTRQKEDPYIEGFSFNTPGGGGATGLEWGVNNDTADEGLTLNSNGGINLNNTSNATNIFDTAGGIHLEVQENQGSAIEMTFDGICIQAGTWGTTFSGIQLLNTADSSGGIIITEQSGNGVEFEADSLISFNSISNPSVNVNMALPTADPLSEGQLWNSGGVVMISAG